MSTIVSVFESGAIRRKVSCLIAVCSVPVGNSSGLVQVIRIASQSVQSSKQMNKGSTREGEITTKLTVIVAVVLTRVLVYDVMLPDTISNKPHRFRCLLIHVLPIGAK